jgi:hypothetical protein
MGEVAFGDQHHLRVARDAAGEGVRHAERQRVRQYGNFIRTRGAGGKDGDGVAQDVGFRIAPRQHAPARLGVDMRRLRLGDAAGSLHLRVDQPRGAEFCGGQELVLIGGERQRGRGEGRFGRYARGVEQAKIFRQRRRDDGKLQRFARPGIVRQPGIGIEDRPGKAEVDQGLGGSGGISCFG